MSIGTLIVFIAMILVAAVVFIRTSGVIEHNACEVVTASTAGFHHFAIGPLSGPRIAFFHG